MSVAGNYPCWGRRCAVFEPVSQAVHRQLPEAVCVLPNGGEADVRVAGGRDVVEAGDGHLLGHAEAAPDECVHQPEGTSVVECGDGGGPALCGALEDLVGGMAPDSSVSPPGIDAGSRPHRSMADR